MGPELQALCGNTVDLDGENYDLKKRTLPEVQWRDEDVPVCVEVLAAKKLAKGTNAPFCKLYWAQETGNGDGDMLGLTPKSKGVNPAWGTEVETCPKFCFPLSYDKELPNMKLKVEVWNSTSESEGDEGVEPATLLGSATLSGATLLGISELGQHRAKYDPGFTGTCDDDKNSDDVPEETAGGSQKKKDKDKEKDKGKGKGKKGKGDAVVECKLASGSGGKAGAAGVIELRFSVDKNQLLDDMRAAREKQIKLETVTGSMCVSAILTDRVDFFDVVPNLK